MKRPSRLARWNPGPRVAERMEEERIVHPAPSDVSAVDGAVQLDGPDAVDVAMTPEAAEETSERLIDQAVKARGQRRLSGLTHRAKD